MEDHLLVHPLSRDSLSVGNRDHKRSFFIMLGCRFRDRQARPRPLEQTARKVALCSLVLLCSLGGCYWLKYEKLTHTHVELLLDMTDKMSRLLEENETITPTMMTEFLYPLERARDFIRIASQRYPDRQSLAVFGQFLDIYERIVNETDRLRIVSGDLDTFRTHAQTLQQFAPHIEAALKKEQD